MKSMLKRFGAYALSMTILGGLVMFSSCDNDEDPVPTQTVWEIVQSTDGLDSLEKYIDLYDLEGALNTTPNITLFAPDNNAFINLLNTPGFPGDVSSINPDIITFVLSYHVVAQVINSGDLVSGAEFATLITTADNPDDVIGVNPDGTLATGSTNENISVLTADIGATNGVVHIVESVMVPPSVGATLTPILGTNAGTLLLGASFSELARAIAAADGYASANSLPTLTSILAAPVPPDGNIHTVFAPTNDTFVGAGIDVNSFTPQEWYGIIANHVVPGQDVTVSDLTSGATFTTAAMGTLFTVTGDPVNGVGVFFDSNGDFDPSAPDPTKLDAEVVVPAVEGTESAALISSNGRVHVIAGVLIPAP